MLTYADVCGYVGSIINQFAMDEHDGHLRVATTRGEMWAVPSTSESAITILNKELAVVGLLTGLAPGTHFTCFTSTKVQILTPEALGGRRAHVLCSFHARGLQLLVYEALRCIRFTLVA
jgi:hypothetical protein